MKVLTWHAIAQIDRSKNRISVYLIIGKCPDVIQTSTGSVCFCMMSDEQKETVGDKNNKSEIKIKSEGVKHCCYGTCNSDTRYRHREGMEGVRFIPFPKPLSQKEKCERWIKACGRPLEDFNVGKIKRCTYICSKHFIGGNGPTPEHPDPIPALLHSDEQVGNMHIFLTSLQCISTNTVCYSV